MEDIWDSYYASCGHVTLHTSAVVNLWTNIPTRCVMMAPLCVVSRFDMYYHAGSRGFHRIFIKTYGPKVKAYAERAGLTLEFIRIFKVITH